MDNIEAFNKVVTLVFADLLVAFPVARRLDAIDYAEKLGISVSDYTPPPGVITLQFNTFGEICPGMRLDEFLRDTLTFLADEGFITVNRGQYRLSAKALAILNAPVEGLDISMATRVQNVAKDIGKETGRSVIAELVGQIIGASFRAVTN